MLLSKKRPFSHFIAIEEQGSKKLLKQENGITEQQEKISINENDEFLNSKTISSKYNQPKEVATFSFNTGYKGQGLWIGALANAELPLASSLNRKIEICGGIDNFNNIFRPNLNIGYGEYGVTSSGKNEYYSVRAYTNSYAYGADNQGRLGISNIGTKAKYQLQISDEAYASIYGSLGVARRIRFNKSNFMANFSQTIDHNFTSGIDANIGLSIEKPINDIVSALAKTEISYNSYEGINFGVGIEFNLNGGFKQYGYRPLVNR